MFLHVFENILLLMRTHHDESPCRLERMSLRVAVALFVMGARKRCHASIHGTHGSVPTHAFRSERIHPYGAEIFQVLLPTSPDKLSKTTFLNTRRGEFYV